MFLLCLRAQSHETFQFFSSIILDRIVSLSSVPTLNFSLAILIKWVGFFEIKPLLNFGSAPATLKYLSIMYVTFFGFCFNKYCSALNLDSPYGLSGLSSLVSEIILFFPESP